MVLSTVAIVGVIALIAVAGVDAGHVGRLVPATPSDTTATATTGVPPATIVPHTTESPTSRSIATPASTGSALIIVSARVVDETGRPFPNGTGAVMACDQPKGIDCPTTGAGAMEVSADTDSDGVVHLALKPNAVYRVTGFATNTGWCHPWISPTGVPFHFSEELVTSGTDLEGAVMVVLKPAC